MPFNANDLLVDAVYTIQKKPEKYGWHYVDIIEIKSTERSKAGLVRVKGWVDGYEISQFNLLPIKTGGVRFPIKDAIRKAIGKKLGDTVQIRFYRDLSALEIPADFSDSLSFSPKAFDFFQGLSEPNQKYYIDWVLEAKSTQTQAQRMLKTIERLEKKKRFWDWDKKEE